MAAIAAAVVTETILDVTGEMTEMGKGEALWSWSTGGEQEDSSSSLENEFLADSNWTTFLNGTDEDGLVIDGLNESNWWTSPVYPSGYTPLGLVIASIFVTIIMIVIVGGNILVIIAIATERSLKGIQNWFIGSLAVADCLLGLIIMPFSLANEMMGYWVFGQWWCDVHSAVDVLLCTSSIMNLCLISLDRYWSITHAIEYLRKRTPERVVIMIATVWILSGLVSIPPLLGWKKETPQGEFPKCELSEDIGYVLYSALGSFYIPSCIMVFVYIRIYFAARARARRAQENKIKRRQSQTKEQKEKEQQLELAQRKQQQAKQQQQQQEQMEMIEKVPIGKSSPAHTPDKDPQQPQPPSLANNGSAAIAQQGTPILLPAVSESRVSLINIKSAANSAVDIRRHSLTTGDELKGLKLSPGFSAGMPSISMDRLSVVDGRNKRNKEGVLSDVYEVAYSTAPGSLMVINESSSAGDDDNHPSGSSLGAENDPNRDEVFAEQPMTSPIPRPSSLKNGVDRTSPGARHSVTFECQSIDNVITYSMVRCSVFNGDTERPPTAVKVTGVEGAMESTVTVTALATAATSTAPAASELALSAPPVNRRASLLLPTRRRFEKLARRFGAGNTSGPLTVLSSSSGAEGSGLQQQQQQPPTIGETALVKRTLKSDTEWSTSSYPSSTGFYPDEEEEDHQVESPSPTASDVPTVLASTPQVPSAPAANIGPGTAASVPAAANNSNNHSTSTRHVANNSNHRSVRSGDVELTENEMASDGGLDPSSSDSGTMARCTVVRPLKIRFCRPSNSGSVNKKSSKAKRQVIDTGRVVVREKDPARERRRISRQREKRATLILGLIMGAFIACWLPFFFLYLLAPVCPSCNIQPWGFAFAFWLGYINSALNPVIYTIFNKDFRRAFRRIIFRCTIAHY